MTTPSAAVMHPAPGPVTVATTFETANPPGGHLTGAAIRLGAPVLFISCGSLIAKPSDRVSRLPDTRPKKKQELFTTAPRDHLCRAYCCGGKTAHDNQYDNDFHGGLSMRNAFVQAVLDVTAVVFGLLFLMSVAASIPLAVFIMFFATY